CEQSIKSAAVSVERPDPARGSCPEEPDRFATSVSGVIGFPGFLCGSLISTIGGSEIAADNHRIGEVVVVDGINHRKVSRGRCRTVGGIQSDRPSDCPRGNNRGDLYRGVNREGGIETAERHICYSRKICAVNGYRSPDRPACG